MKKLGKYFAGKNFFKTAFGVWTLLILVAHLTHIVTLTGIGSFLLYFLSFAAVFFFVLLALVKIFGFDRLEIGGNMNISLVNVLFFFVMAVFLLVSADTTRGFSFPEARVALFFLFKLAKLLFISFFLILAFYGLGKKTLNVLKLTSLNFLEEALFSVGLGIGFFSYAAYFLSIVGMAYPLAVYLLAAAVISFSLKETIFLLKKIWGAKILVKKEKNWFVVAVILGLLFLFIAVGAASSLANLMSAGWDSFHQYLTFPKEYAENHGLVDFKFHPHWGFPQLAEMIFLLGLLAGGIKMPFLLNFVLFLLTLAGIGTLLNRIAKNSIFYILMLFVSIPLVAVFSQGYVKTEFFLSYYIILILIALHRMFYERRNNRQIFIVFSIFCGLLPTVKYTAFFFIFALFLALLVFRKNLNFNFKKFAIFPAIVFLLFLPWGIKNVVYYHSPLYPLVKGDDFFSDKLNVSCQNYFRTSCEEDILVHGGNAHLKKSIGALSNLLILSTYFSYKSGFSAQNVSPWFLIFLPVIVFCARKTKNDYIKMLYWLSFGYLFMWLIFFSGQMWYLLPFYLVFLIILGCVNDNLICFSKTRFFAIAAIFWLAIITLLSFMVGVKAEKMRYARGEIGLIEALKISSDDARKSNGEDNRIDWQKMWSYINEEIIDKNPGKIIYGFTDAQGYFIKDSHSNFIPDFYGYLFSCLENGGNIYEKLKQSGVGYILSSANPDPMCGIQNRNEFQTCRVQDQFQSFVKQHNLPIVHKEGDIILYQLE